ncbi:MAG: hypothetical protein ACPGVT_01030 [Maricaulaceae bacterium]
MDAVLNGCSELKRTSYLQYGNSDEFPWVEVVAVFGDEKGNYRVIDTHLFDTVNQIELICAYDGSEATENPYYKLAKKIASRFGWDVYDSITEQCV